MLCPHTLELLLDGVACRLSGSKEQQSLEEPRQEVNKFSSHPGECVELTCELSVLKSRVLDVCMEWLPRAHSSPRRQMSRDAEQGQHEVNLQVQ